MPEVPALPALPELSALSTESRRFDPPAALAGAANVGTDAYDAAAKDRLGFWAKIDSTIAAAPMTKAAIRATRTSSPSLTSPRLITLA